MKNYNTVETFTLQLFVVIICPKTDTEDRSLSPGQTDRQVVASGCKFNLRRDLRWVAKRTRKFYRKYAQVA